MAPERVATPLALVPAESFIVKEPYGVVLIIGPFNYPIQLTVNPLAAALAAGNVAVIKPSELTPASSSLIARLLPTYLDPQALSIIQGAIPETTALLKQHFDYIFFTGSEGVGKVILRAAAEFLTPCTLELGGKSPVIVAEDADLQLAARRILWGKCANAGQSCIAPDYVYAHAKVKKELLQLLKLQTELFYGKDVKNNPDFGRIVNRSHTERLQRVLNEHKADIVCGGDVDVENKYVAPTVLDVGTNSKVMQSEIFGPILPVIEYTDIKSVLSYINSKPKPLALYLFSSNSDLHKQVIDKTSSGGVSINDVMMHFANPELPFGGVGASGVGAYHGKHGFDVFSHSKPVLNKSRWLDASVRYPPYSNANYKLFRYVAEIYRVNSDSFNKLFKIVFWPIVAAVVAKSLGLTIGFKSNL